MLPAELYDVPDGIYGDVEQFYAMLDKPDDPYWYAVYEYMQRMRRRSERFLASLGEEEPLR